MKRRILLLYGSQTGNSQDIAETVLSESVRYQIALCCQSMDDYRTVKLIQEELVVFVCSTTGQGDEPDNMKIFWRFLLKKSLPSNSLINMKYTILGLGDSSYTKYNFVGKRLNKRLLQLGASPFIPLTLVDEQSPLGPDAVVEQWLDKLWEWVFAYFGIPWTLRKSEVYLKPLLKYHLSTSHVAQLITDFEKIPAYEHPSYPLLYASVEENARLTPLDHFQDTRLMTLDVGSPPIEKYHPFDVLQVYPQNTRDTITTFSDFYGLDLDRAVGITLNNRPSQEGDYNLKEGFLQKYPHVLDLTTNPKLRLGDLVAKFMDLQCVPRRSFFRHLAYYSLTCYNLINDFWTTHFSKIAASPLPGDDDINHRERITKSISLRLAECIYEEEQILPANFDQIGPENILVDAMLEYKNRLEAEKDRLAELCAPNDTGREELYSYCNRVRRNTCEVLHDFPATAQAIPFSHLLSIIPSIQPRSFSIANAYNYLYKPHQGGKHEEIGKLQILVAVVEYKTKLYKPRRGTCSFWLSTLQLSTRIPVCIKTGYIQHSLSMVEKPLMLVGPGTGVAPLRALIQQRVSMKVGGNYLFFGCRNWDKDHYFATEFAHYESMGLLKTFNAFSRDQPDRVYVQHVIKRESQLVHQLLVGDGAFVYVSGRSKNMPDEVLKAFSFALITHGNYDEESAKTFVEKMIAQKRIQMETWD